MKQNIELTRFLLTLVAALAFAGGMSACAAEDSTEGGEGDGGTAGAEGDEGDEGDEGEEGAAEEGAEGEPAPEGTEGEPAPEGTEGEAEGTEGEMEGMEGEPEMECATDDDCGEGYYCDEAAMCMPEETEGMEGDEGMEGEVEGGEGTEGEIEGAEGEIEGTEGAAEGTEGGEVVECTEPNLDGASVVPECPAVECDPAAELPFDPSGTWEQKIVFTSNDCPDFAQEILPTEDVSEMEFGDGIYGTCIIDPANDCRPTGAFAADFSTGSFCFATVEQGQTIIVKTEFTSIQDGLVTGTATVFIGMLNCTLQGDVTVTRL